MEFCVQISWRFSINYSLGVIVLLGMVLLSDGYGTCNFKPTQWSLAHATFYGDETASATIGGACGYGDLFKNGYGKITAAISPVLFMNGKGCGGCYQLMCVDSKWCITTKGGAYGGYGGGSTSVIVTATNLSPPSWLKPSKGYTPGVHFDLSVPAFKKIAISQGGIIPIKYRRVPCVRKGGITFTLQGNNYWLLAFPMNVGGAGDIAQMWVKGCRTGWISMAQNWGTAYQAFAQLGGQSLSFKLQSYSTRQVIVAYNVIPPYWRVGMTYQAKVNFH